MRTKSCCDIEEQSTRLMRECQKRATEFGTSSYFILYNRYNIIATIAKQLKTKAMERELKDPCKKCKIGWNNCVIHLECRRNAAYQEQEAKKTDVEPRW